MNRRREMPAFALLTQLLQYNPDTGILIWKQRGPEHFTCLGAWRHFNNTFAGREAGSYRHTPSGEAWLVTIRVVSEGIGRGYVAHRLACVLMGVNLTVEQDVDHIDRNPHNNRWDNLRVATRPQNCANSVSRKRNGCSRGLPKGVSVQLNRYKAQIMVNGNKRHLGMFSTPEAASEAYTRAASEAFNEFARS